MRLALVLLLLSSTARAYRPFDSTDAVVAPRGEVELELGPVGYLFARPQHFLVFPNVILNLGLTRRWELVAQGRHLLRVDGNPESRIADTALLLKGVLRDGTLQGTRGPSVAAELGPLLPTTSADRLGATAILILSYRWRALTAHFNGALTLTRASTLDMFAGLILEGPWQWRVRPVAEVFVERDFDSALVISGLAGAIWRARDGWSFDIAGRVARVNDLVVGEVRLGFTWTYQFGRTR